MARIFVFGGGGHARVVMDVISSRAEHEIVGIVDSFRAKGTEVAGHPILGSEDDVEELSAAHGVQMGIVAVGDNWERFEVTRAIEGRLPGFGWVRAIHARAWVAASSEIGAGSVVMAGAVVNPGCEIGPACIVNTASSLDHDGTMGRFSSLAPGAHVGGGVRIGEFSSICLGASVIHSVEVGAHAVVGAGATVLEDVPERVVAYGSPARVVRSRGEGEPYL
ncbi:MAG: NeuD/PglB/VioB family sugar acetyltransferase [Gemmatimonadetes bacterium]|nr:NeuD/PglB/VioB family sugar acetyltransferase [Gemmatimonadota bacterium]